VSSFTDDVDYDAPILPPPSQFDDSAAGADDFPPLPLSPPPPLSSSSFYSPAAINDDDDHYSEQQASETSSSHSSKMRPYSDTDALLSSLDYTTTSPSSSSSSNAVHTRSTHNHHREHSPNRDRPVSYAGVHHLHHCADDGDDNNNAAAAALADHQEVFHIHMKTTPVTQPVKSKESNNEVVADPSKTFAGRRDVRDLRQLHERQIVSVRGTVRGFKNRVRAGISTFIDPKTNKVSDDTVCVWRGCGGYMCVCVCVCV
jgi:hypothetical protein